MSKVSCGRLTRPGLVGPKPRAKAVGDGQSVDIPIPPEIVCTARCHGRGRRCAEAALLSRQPVRSDRGSKGVTGNGRSSALWLCASKLVGGEDRQIRPLVNSEKRMKGES